jgi:hypothetical protein
VACTNSDVDESFIVAQTDDMNAWRLRDVRHASDHVGRGGTRALLSLYDPCRHWSCGAKPYSVSGRLVDPRLAKTIYGGGACTGVVACRPLSHRWDDLTDIDHQWTSRAGSKKMHRKSSLVAQDVRRTTRS